MVRTQSKIVIGFLVIMHMSFLPVRGYALCSGNKAKAIAFMNCTGLTSVTISNSVTSIGVQAFFLCVGTKARIAYCAIVRIVQESFLPIKLPESGGWNPL